MIFHNALALVATLSLKRYGAAHAGHETGETTVATTTSGTTTHTTTTTTSLATTTTTTTSDIPGYCSPTGSKVRIHSLVSNKPLQVFEVQVLSSGTDVASDGTASQSTTYKRRNKFAASNALDGSTSTFAHTDPNVEKYGWWEVDLGGSYPVDFVFITNRWCRDTSDPFNCLCRLSHSAVLLLDDSGDWVASEFIGDTCGQFEVNVTFSCTD